MSSLLRSPWVINGQRIFRQTCPRGILCLLLRVLGILNLLILVTLSNLTIDFNRNIHLPRHKAISLCQMYLFNEQSVIILWVNWQNITLICQKPVRGIYHKVERSNISHVEVQAGYFRLLMKVIFDPYVLWPFDKKLIS